MKQTGFYGQNVRRLLHLEHVPPSLIKRSLRNAEIAVTETRDDAFRAVVLDVLLDETLDAISGKNKYGFQL